MSRVSNMYSFSVYKYIYISILWAVVMSGSRGGGPSLSMSLICTVTCDHVFMMNV